MIRTGTCSWTEKTLIQSGAFYPPEARSAEARLRYYADRFDTVEIDSTYYALPDARTALLWDTRTPEGFTFHVKAYGALTGHGVDPRTLPGAVRNSAEPGQGGGRFAYVKDRGALKLIAAAMTEALRPLTRSRKLGLTVFQYPPWFTYRQTNMDYVLFCQELMGDAPIAVEFRHGSWFSGARASSVLGFLRDHKITHVAADEPQFGSLATVPFLPAVTSDTAYFRFHGRNRDNWLRKGVETALRYAYLYSDDELIEFVPALRKADGETKTTFAMFNNCYTDYGVRNAAALKRMLADDGGVSGEGG